MIQSNCRARPTIQLEHYSSKLAVELCRCHGPGYRKIKLCKEKFSNINTYSSLVQFKLVIYMLALQVEQILVAEIVFNLLEFPRKKVFKTLARWHWMMLLGSLLHKSAQFVKLHNPFCRYLCCPALNTLLHLPTPLPQKGHGSRDYIMLCQRASTCLLPWTWREDRIESFSTVE